MTGVDVVETAGVHATVEFARHFGWDTAVEPAPDRMVCVTATRGPSTVNTWWTAAGTLYDARLYRLGGGAEFGEVGRTVAAATVCGWLADNREAAA